MAKITVETKEDPVRLGLNQESIQPTEAETKKVFEVAQKTFALLEEVHQSSGVEIIKATAWKGFWSGSHESRVLIVDFQLVFCPCLAPTVESEKETLKVVATWNNLDNVIAVLGEAHHRSMPNILHRITPQNGEVETLARGLIEAMQVGVRDRQAHLNRLVDWLGETDKKLGSLSQIKASV